MESRTYKAREMSEALALVRRELGPDAVIVGTRKVAGRALGLLGGSFVEVTAAPPEGEEAPSGSTEESQADTDASTDQLLAQRRASRARTTPRRPVRDLIESNPEVALAAVSGRVAPHAALRRRLLAAMVPRDLCERWLSKLQAPDPSSSARAAGEASLRAYLHASIGSPAPLCGRGSRVAAVVGPTGVGKTTTIAKLAANARLVEGKRVALISLDDQRIGGTTGLRAYARLLELPMTTASAEGGLSHAIARFADADLILVDTAGLSPNRPKGYTALAKQLARAGEPVTSHLCVTASTRCEELDRILHLYSAARPSALLPTKLDEAVAIGSVLAARDRLDGPLSFATTGQQVPDDITPATATFIVDLLLGGAQA